MNEISLIQQNKLKYSIEVYKDHAIIRGCLTSNVLTLLIKLCKEEGFTIKLCKEEGFTHMQSFEGGFKLVSYD
jgi:hypothetical protein